MATDSGWRTLFIGRSGFFSSVPLKNRMIWYLVGATVLAWPVQPDDQSYQLSMFSTTFGMNALSTLSHRDLLRLRTRKRNWFLTSSPPCLKRAESFLVTASLVSVHRRAKLIRTVILVLLILGGYPFNSPALRLIDLPLARVQGLSMSGSHLDTNLASMNCKILTKQEQGGKKTCCMNP